MFTKGFNNCRNAVKKIDRHRNLKSHRDALPDAIVHSKTSLRKDCQLVQATELERKYWREILRLMIDVIAKFAGFTWT